MKPINKPRDAKWIIIALAIALGAVLLCVTCVQAVRNKAVRLEEQIDVAKSDIEVQQKRRVDLIPNLVDCVKAYDQYEYETILSVVRQRGYDADEVQTRVMAVAEAYPELKSSSHYRELMNELATTENLIASFRANYNKQVRSYRQFVRRFPNTMLLSAAGYETMAYEYLRFDTSEDAPSGLFEGKRGDSHDD